MIYLSYKFKDFGIPSRIKKVSSEEELIKLVNIYNGIVPCYSSLYWYEVVSIDEFNNEIRKSYIDKIFFDIDEDLESAKKLVKYLLDKDLKFQLYHSGRGWHFYIECTDGNASNLRIAQLSILHESKANADMHCVGDLARISRIPNTWNHKSNSYCIPIKIEELGIEEDSVQRIGQKFIYGNKILNLSSYTEDKFESIKPEIIQNMHINTKIVLLPCIRNIVSKINPTQIERYCLVVYLSNAIRNGKDLRGFDKYTISEEIMKFFDENCQHWMDYNRRISKYQIENIIPKSNIITGCKFLKSKGICMGCLPRGI